MKVETVTTADRSLLPAVRRVLGDAEQALLCVAFVQEKGLRLIAQELKALGARGKAPRLLVTTTFQATPDPALAMACSLGMQVRVLNPGSGQTYHPKMYLGRSARHLDAVIGSPNLTGGLFSNVEAAVSLRGRGSEPPLRRAWEWAEEQWSDPRAYPWTPAEVEYVPAEEPIAPELYAALAVEVRRDPVFLTLGRSPRPNRVTGLTPTEVQVETERSQGRHGGSEPIPAWMLNLAWDRLRVMGTLSNRELLQDLRVHRSSAVCALLDRIPGVVQAPGPNVVLRWSGPPASRRR